MSFDLIMEIVVSCGLHVLPAPAKRPFPLQVLYIRYPPPLFRQVHDHKMILFLKVAQFKQRIHQLVGTG